MTVKSEPEILVLTSSTIIDDVTLQSKQNVDFNIDVSQSLPNEVLLRIFYQLDARQLLICSQVSRRWRLLCDDWQLWQAKLLEIMELQWCTIICNEQPSNEISFRDLNAIHPREIYKFLLQYIPKYQYNNLTTENIKLESVDGNFSRIPFFTVVNNFLNNFRNLFPRYPRVANTTLSKPRFALFGPGFDHQHTNRLFRKMVDTKTKSFEPIDIYTEHVGFDSGITLRLFAQAQKAATDRYIFYSQENIPTMLSQKSMQIDDSLASPNHCSSYQTCPSTSPNLNVQGAQPSRSFNFQPSEDQLLEDFTFDLSYLYSLPAHLKSLFNDQYTRLTVSRLFEHSNLLENNTGPIDVDVLKTLCVNKEMQNLCRTLNGLVYAIDARESAEQLSYLHFELNAVLRGFPLNVSDTIPIVILYIMPKEDIHVSILANTVPLKLPSKPPLINRDSYSGYEYTTSWHDSLLLPISTLRLFELKNPWRLQKCSSNDIKTLIQSIMWLHKKQASK